MAEEVKCQACYQEVSTAYNPGAEMELCGKCYAKDMVEHYEIILETVTGIANKIKSGQELTDQEEMWVKKFYGLEWITYR